MNRKKIETRQANVYTSSPFYTQNLKQMLTYHFTCVCVRVSFAHTYLVNVCVIDYIYEKNTD